MQLFIIFVNSKSIIFFFTMVSLMLYKIKKEQGSLFLEFNSKLKWGEIRIKLQKNLKNFGIYNLNSVMISRVLRILCPTHCMRKYSILNVKWVAIPFSLKKRETLRSLHFLLVEVNWVWISNLLLIGSYGEKFGTKTLSFLEQVQKSLFIITYM